MRKSGNKNRFKEVDAGYDQEWEVRGDFCDNRGRSTPWDDRNSLGYNSA